MKKKFLFLIIAIIMIIALLYYFNSTYSLGEVENLIANTHNTTNFHINIEFFNKENQSTGQIDYYKKDKFLYIIQNTIEAGKAETLTNIETQETISILHNPKIINKSKDSNKEIEIFSLSEFKQLVENKGKYRYCGRENVNSLECIKISFELNDNLEYFYIDLESGNIVQTELYKNSEKILTTKYTYMYNSVIDDDILKFDIQNYSDYVYREI